MDPRLDLDLVRTFVTVAEMHSFTRAAKQLGLSQSATSLQIQRLEEGLDTKLFRRNRRSVQLSAAGEAFLVYARRLLALQSEAIRSVRRSRARGPVRLGIPAVYAIRYLPAIYERFQERYPEVIPEVYCDVSARVVERFEAGDLDLAVVVKHDVAPQGELLGRDEIVWVASPSLHLEADEPVPLAVYPEYCVFRAHGLRALAEAGRSWKIVFTTQSHSALEVAVSKGWAMAIRARRTCHPQWRIRGPSEGFPRLPSVDLELRAGAGRASVPVTAFRTILENEIRTDLLT